MEVIALGVPMKCTYSQGNTAVTSYIKGKKVYSEVNQQGKEAFLIIKDNCMWSWSADESQGVKICSEEDFWETPKEYAQEGQASLPTEAEYYCVPSIFTDARFDLPTNINFIDTEELIEGKEQE